MRALVLGGTGAMGSHVCIELAERGWDIVSTTRRERRSEKEGVAYVIGDAHDFAFLDSLLTDRWDAVIDFMVWTTAEFRERYEKLLSNTNQYVFTSSYRVYADSPLITERSPRLLDVIDDSEYLSTDEYALSKARCEDMLFQSGKNNWTIVRPAITYDGSVGRLQLTVLESGQWLWRACNGIPVPLPIEILNKQATMSWGGDIAKMIACLVGNSDALGEVFTVSGSDHMTWGQVVEAYQCALPSLKVLPCDLADFERVRGGVYQIRYDRMFDRVVDNSKILEVTGIQSSELQGMEEGLVLELIELLKNGVPALTGVGLQAKFDRLVGGFPSAGNVAKEGGMLSLAKYMVKRFAG